LHQIPKITKYVFKKIFCAQTNAALVTNVIAFSFSGKSKSDASSSLNFDRHQ
jgi:hypothetical protein